MEIITIAQKIENKILELDVFLEKLKNVGEIKSKTIVEYDKTITITLLKLRNGLITELDGIKIINPQTTILEKLAKGICFKESLEKEKADVAYKSLLTTIEAIEAQLNGYQSINRHLKEI